MILDTSFLVDLLRGKQEAVKKISELEEKNEPVATTAIGVFEIWQCIPKKASEKQAEKALEMLRSINTLSLDLDSALEAGEIQRKLKAKGETMDPEDAMIAGIAKVQRKKVLTRNERHFSRITSLEVETY